MAATLSMKMWMDVIGVCIAIPRHVCIGTSTVEYASSTVLFSFVFFSWLRALHSLMSNKQHHCGHRKQLRLNHAWTVTLAGARYILLFLSLLKTTFGTTFAATRSAVELTVLHRESERAVARPATNWRTRRKECSRMRCQVVVMLQSYDMSSTMNCHASNVRHRLWLPPEQLRIDRTWCPLIIHHYPKARLLGTRAIHLKNKNLTTNSFLVPYVLRGGDSPPARRRHCFTGALENHDLVHQKFPSVCMWRITDWAHILTWRSILAKHWPHEGCMIHAMYVCPRHSNDTPALERCSVGIWYPMLHPKAPLTAPCWAQDSIITSRFLNLHVAVEHWWNT